MSSDAHIACPDHVLLLFVDGLGWRQDAQDNPVNDTTCPTLSRWIRRHAVPVDPGLGVPGAPQSATGQAALFTGVDVPARIGRHLAGFPGPRVRALVEEDNLFLRLKRRGVSCKFANGYVGGGLAEISARRFRSVTTVMALTVPESISTHQDLLADGAVAEDLVREGVRARGYDGPSVEPEVAADHLLDVLRLHGLVLFEFFQTDRAGHANVPERTRAVLATLDRFLTRLDGRLDRSCDLLLLTSDHGNIEDSSSTTHTRNPVPLVAIGCGAGWFLRQVRRLCELTPCIEQALAAGSSSPPPRSPQRSRCRTSKEFP